MSVDVTTTPRAVDVIGNIAANWTSWQCRGHLKTHFKPALSLSLRVRRHSSPGEGKTFNCYESSVYTSQSTGWDCVAWPGVYTTCASAFYTATSATTSRERTPPAHSNVKQGRRSCRKNGGTRYVVAKRWDFNNPYVNVVFVIIQRDTCTSFSSSAGKQHQHSVQRFGNDNHLTH